MQYEWQEELYAVIGNLLNEQGCKPIIINGIEDHVHCLFALPPRKAISDVIKVVKAKSSKWINENKKCPSRFEWQIGYGCFSCGKSRLNTVERYIKRQKEHHKIKSFLNEYVNLLEKHDAAYEEKHVFAVLE